VSHGAGACGPAKQAAASRGAAKLRAAVDRFRLTTRIAGARALDVGAGAGGCTAIMLEHGAAHVPAVDVSAEHLDPDLRVDRHVTVVAGVHFKSLPRALAPGPFDFFALDVSFVAARSLVRSLACRLRPGAEGVVVVKPQWELPPDRARAVTGKDDAAARRDALALLRAKAAPLGFTLLGQAPSPVSSRSGTVELLTHWRFEGPTELLPGPPDETGPQGPAPRPADAGPVGPRGAGARGSDTEPAGWRLFAVAAPGLEEVVAQELRCIPDAGGVTPVAGGVTFSGDLETIWRANLGLRVATRVLARLGEVRARDFARFRRDLGRLPWPLVADGPRRVSVSATTHACRLYHTGALTENLVLALRDALGPDAVVPENEDAPRLTVYLRGVEDTFTVSIDTSGELLHRRGWRTEAGAAPLRETLAAGLLALASWDPRTPLVDPFCGSGTIVLEAAGLALGRPPGAGRAFAFESWPGHDEARYRSLLDTATPAPPPRLPPLVGLDSDAQIIVTARRNAERAGLTGQVRFAAAPLSEAEPPPGSPGLVLGNPRLYRTLGQVLRVRFAGWRVGILTADRNLPAHLRLRPAATHPLSNGGVRVALYLFSM
jgi:putative N6-adenine-specific DNA methylase